MFRKGFELFLFAFEFSLSLAYVLCRLFDLPVAQSYPIGWWFLVLHLSVDLVWDFFRLQRRRAILNCVVGVAFLAVLQWMKGDWIIFIIAVDACCRAPSIWNVWIRPALRNKA